LKENKMIFWIVVLVFIFLIWHLLFSGLLWKIILFFGGWIGVYCLLKAYIPASSQMVAGSNFSWAVLVPSVICLLALVHTRS
jgi:hypothetical protein